jgi:hypothetical protein
MKNIFRTVGEDTYHIRVVFLAVSSITVFERHHIVVYHRQNLPFEVATIFQGMYHLLYQVWIACFRGAGFRLGVGLRLGSGSCQIV